MHAVGKPATFLLEPFSSLRSFRDGKYAKKKTFICAAIWREIAGRLSLNFIRNQERNLASISNVSLWGKEGWKKRPPAHLFDERLQGTLVWTSFGIRIGISRQIATLVYWVRRGKKTRRTHSFFPIIPRGPFGVPTPSGFLRRGWFFRMTKSAPRITRVGGILLRRFRNHICQNEWVFLPF